MCSRTDGEDTMLLCDGCDKGFHTHCLTPPVMEVPVGLWFCASCAHARSAQAEIDRGRAASHAQAGPNPASTCVVCGTTHARAGTLLTCLGCEARVHSTCIGLGKHAFLGGYFHCASCELALAAPTAKGLPQEAVDDAHFLVLLKSKSVQDSSQATYASGLHRWVRWARDRLHLAPDQVLPPGRGETVSQSHVHLFIAYAARKYKPATIRSTLDALRHWCSTKGVDPHALNHPQTLKLLKAVQVQQGPSGLPTGKVGMSKSMLKLLMCYCATQARSNTVFSPLMHRDVAWLVLGFFGFLRRSELIALRMQDVSLSGTSGTPFISLLIRRSKTDAVGAGAQVVIAGTVGNWDLATKVRRYVDLRVAMGATGEDPFLVSWDLDAYRLSSKPLSTGQALAERLKTLLTKLKKEYPSIDVNPNSYGMHSLRRGGVMAAWAAGVDIEKIKAHGRWKSDAVRVYMTPDLSIRLAVTKAM